MTKKKKKSDSGCVLDKVMKHYSGINSVYETFL